MLAHIIYPTYQQRQNELSLIDKGCLQQAVWQYGGATNIFSTFCSLIGSSPGFTFTIELLLLSSSSVILFGSGSGLEVFQIPPHRQAVTVSCNTVRPLYS
jgi:hypothetical protein